MTTLKLRSKRTIESENIPIAKVVKHAGKKRYDVVNELAGSQNIGIELGVAAASFSQKALAANKFDRLYGVDIYGDWHDTADYKHALNKVGIVDKRFCLLRLDFENALDLFEDEYFDFIYIDGYAHTGEEGGKTIIDYYPKLKVGGIIAGDDYHMDWPLVVWAVNNVANQIGGVVNVIGSGDDPTYGKYPTWYLRKPHNQVELRIDEALFELGMKEKILVDKKIRSKHGLIHSAFRKLRGKRA